MLNASAAIDAILGSPLPSGSVNETEPNNSRTAANVLRGPATVLGSMASSSVKDFFKITLPPGKTLTAAMTPAAASLDYDLYLLSSSGATLQNSMNGASKVDSVSCPNTGSISRVVDVQVLHDAGGAGSYTLTVNW